MLALLLLATALAQTSEEITVWGDRIEAAWADLDRTMAELGYEGRVRDGRTVYKATGSGRWKPRFVVDHDGWARFRSPNVVLRTVSISGISLSESDRRYVPYTGVSATGIGVQFHFWMTASRVLKARERELASATDAKLHAIREALAEQVHADRLATLEPTLERLWSTGAQPDGTVLERMDARREALLTLWATRTATPEGEAVREVVETFLRNVVQRSDTPVTEAEAAAAAERCPCGRSPEL